MAGTIKVQLKSGQVVNLPSDVTAEEIDALEKSSTPSPTPKAVAPEPLKPVAPPMAPSHTENIKDQLKQGFSGGLGALGGLVTGLVKTGREMAGADIEVGPDGKQKGFLGHFSDFQDKSKFFGENALGQKGYESDTFLGKVGNAGIRSLTDPTTLLGAGKVAAAGVTTALKAGVRPALGEVAKRTAVGLAANAAGGAGGQAGAEAAKANDMGPAAQFVAALIGGGASGMTGAAMGSRATKVAKSSYQKAAEAMPEFAAKFGVELNPGPAGMTGAAAQASDLFAKTAAQSQVSQRVFGAAMEHQGATGTPLSEAVGNVRSASAELGVPVPANAVGKNEALGSMMSEAAVDPAFRNAQQSAEAATEAAVRGKVEAIAMPKGDAQSALEGITPKAIQMRDKVMAETERLRQETTKTVENLVGNAGTAQAETLGREAKDLLKAQERIARSKVKPLYDEAIQGAEKRGEAVPNATLVSEAVPILKDQSYRDVFNQYPLLKQATSVMEATALAGKSMPVTQLDSFKRALSEAFNNTDPTQKSQMLRLGVLKDMVFGSKTEEGIRRGGMVDSVSEQFSKEYRSADVAYADLVGKRFGGRAVKDMNRSEYQSTYYTSVIGSPERARQFIQATGDMGHPVLRQTLLKSLADMDRKGTGVTPEMVSKWQHLMREQIDLVPGFKDEVKNHADLITNMTLSRQQLDQQFVEATKKDVLAASRQNPRDPQEAFTSGEAMARKFISQPKWAEGWVRQYGDNPDNLKAMQSFILHDALDSSKPLSHMTRATASNPVVAKIMQPYMNNLQKLYGIVENIRQNPVHPKGDVLKGIPKDGLQNAVGVSFEEVATSAAGTIRSLQNKIFTLAKKGQQFKNDREIQDLQRQVFMDPVKLEALAKQAEIASGKKKGATPEEIAQATRNFSALWNADTGTSRLKSALRTGRDIVLGDPSDRIKGGVIGASRAKYDTGLPTEQPDDESGVPAQ